MGGAGLLTLAAALVAAPFVLQESTKRCTREETVNILIGRVSQARQICVEYGDGSTDAVRAAFFGIRFSPPEPSRDAPFAVIVFGLGPGESVRVVIAPLGIGLQPATLIADRAGEARTDFRIPNGASPEWVVIATRTNGESMTAEVPVRK